MTRWKTEEGKTFGWKSLGLLEGIVDRWPTYIGFSGRLGRNMQYWSYKG